MMLPAPRDVEVQFHMQPQVPSRVYHFTTWQNFAIIVAHNTIRFGSPLSFNDPFDSFIEMYPPLTYDDSAEFMERAAKGQLTNYASMSRANALELKKQVQAYKRSTEERKRIVLENYTKQNRAQLATSNARFIAELRETFRHNRLFCTSATHLHPLMWSHYADSHRGCAIELDTNALLAAWSDCQVRHVIYKEARTALVLAQDVLEAFVCGTQHLLIDRINDDAFYTKALMWSPEAEWRFSLPARSSKVAADLGETRDETFMPIPDDAVTAVYLGCVAEDEARWPPRLHQRWRAFSGYGRMELVPNEFALRVRKAPA